MKLDYLVFLGSARDSTPPRPARLGLRVARRVEALLGEKADVRLVDPLDYDLAGVFKPHFAYARGAAPRALDDLAREIAAADGYVMVSPEYNHSLSPALAHLLNHFGASLFAGKPSAIVTYSAGQWGGVRAAVAMRAFLSEMGCLPVSAMIHVPKAQEVLGDDGEFLASVDADRWTGYFERSLAQLRWWAEAARRQRDEHGEDFPPPFARDPSQRNAP
ncbi:MAG: NAD(P)H-dependent oxidoreductase [Parvibaculum sp.]|uniref:NADPH-dependent FMN reductase n=1 Tax=Parvibaculum sp. TaxID=2024848 RepID=UPI00271B14AC|nr:NAD(P)H-dependent oxidoreductase [Parvibaculum sp.]MDO8839262.1 NAD(P)H-dependent oxidoreductase [Parvibaculum sp.]